MTRLQEQAAYIRLEPLTPVHIGTGDTLDPLSYVMREENGSVRLYPIDLSAWVEDHPDPEGLARFFGSSPLPEIRRRVASELDPLLYGKAPSTVFTRGIYEKYKADLGDRASQSQLLISPMIKNPHTGAVTIPGSSIKGAIRTAVIDWLDREWQLGLKEETARDKRAYGNALEECLGKISDNAFKNLKVGDFPAGLGDSFIVSANEVRRRLSDRPSTPKNDCETTLSRIMTGKPYAVYGKIVLGSHSSQKMDSLLTVSWRGRRKQWDLKDLMGLCNVFYGMRYLKEKQDFYGQAHLQDTAKALETIKEFIAPQAGGMLLRLGHYSHVECMTVTMNAPMTRKTRDDKIMPFGTTRTLANGVYPFGWCLLSLCSEDEYRMACQRREQSDASILNEQASRRNEVVARREAEAREQARIAKEKEEARLKAEQERAAMESLSPEERLVFLVESGKANENQAVELYGKLGGLVAELAKRAALALKNYWVKMNKWEKKACTAKQWDKVQKVKAILDEN